MANFFDLTQAEKLAVLALLDQAKFWIERNHNPDGYHVGVNIGAAGGQSRMHAHLIPRYAGDHPSPRGEVRCVLSGTCKI